MTAPGVPERDGDGAAWPPIRTNSCLNAMFDSGRPYRWPARHAGSPGNVRSCAIPCVGRLLRPGDGGRSPRARIRRRSRTRSEASVGAGTGFQQQFGAGTSGLSRRIGHFSGAIGPRAAPGPFVRCGCLSPQPSLRHLVSTSGRLMPGTFYGRPNPADATIAILRNAQNVKFCIQIC